MNLALVEFSDGTQAVDALLQDIGNFDPVTRHAHTGSQLVWASEFATNMWPKQWVLQPEADKMVPLPVGLVRGQYRGEDGSTVVDHAAFASFGRESGSITVDF